MAEFSLEVAIAGWRRELQAEGVGDEARRELEDHLRSSVERAADAGQAVEQAFASARAQLGEPVVLGEEFTKETNMNPWSKLVGIAVAVAAIWLVLFLEGIHAEMLLQWPPLLLVLGLCVGGLVASHGPKRVWRTLSVALGGSRPPLGEVAELREVCRRGHQLAYSAGVLQTIFGAIGICSHLDQPSLIGPWIGDILIGLVQAVVVAELGFATMERWIARPPRDAGATA